MKKVGLALLMALLSIMAIATPVFAIALPDSTPSLVSTHVYRNVLETGDFLVVVYEDTPYSSVPAVGYSSAFVWRLIDTDGTTEIAQALGYEYNDDGYGYNVISFYLSASNVTAAGITWGDALFLRLSGTPTAFTTPPVYNYSISGYSSLTDTTAVKLSLAETIRVLAADLNNKWGLSTSTTLLDDSETEAVLSIYGQSFFRGAIYGVQAMAPSIFPLVIESTSNTPRTWDTSYNTALANQHTGDPLGDAFDAGETFFDVDYNLLGLLILLVICAVLIIGNWMVSGNGNLWKGAIDCCPALVIGTRIGLMGFGELGLVAAVCWIYVSAKLWRMI